MMQQNQDVTHTVKKPLRRSLVNRQVQMLAIGGVIGVGLFYGATVSVGLAGPGVILDFILCGIIVAIVMRALGEMTVHQPTSGSFSEFAGEAFGARMRLIMAGMWWFYWVATVMSELAAIGKLIQFWLPNFPVWLPGVIALALFTITNLLAVRVFGELEYWFAVLKIMAISVFIIFGLLFAFTGIFRGGEILGLTNLYAHGGFLPHGWLGVVMAVSLVVQAYSGVETLGVEAGESSKPEKVMRRAFRSVTVRIAILYVGSMFVVLTVIPWQHLIGSNSSPYVILFSRIGIPFAASLVNLMIVLSGFSSCNTGLYGGSRMLYGVAQERNIEKIHLTRLNRHQVPSVAVWLTALAISVGILITYLAPNNVYVWITSASAFASLFTWLMILLTEVVLRRRAQQNGQTLSYAMPFWPILPWIGIVLVAGAILAIFLSPLTRVSVFAGLIWLVLMIVYASVQVARRRLNVKSIHS